MRLLVLAAIALAAGCKPAADAPSQQLISREEFMARCKVDDGYLQCAKGVGQPDRTQSGSTSTEYWYFERRTFDRTSGKPDRSAQVTIERGWVKAINFY